MSFHLGKGQRYEEIGQTAREPYECIPCSCVAERREERKERGKEYVW